MKLDPKALKGSITPLVTPFTDSGAVDYDEYAVLVENQIKGGSHGILLTGTSGEPSLLTVEERIQLYKVAMDANRGRIQVVAATGAASHADSAALTEAADKIGVDAMLIVTPFFVRPPQRGLEAYYVDLCGRTERPVMIYHIPGRAGVNMLGDTVVSIVDKRPNLVGMKHAFADLALVTELLTRLGPEFRIHVGLEELSFPMLCVGASGMMNAVGNVMPREVAALYEAVARGDLVAGRALHFALYEINCAVFFDTNPIPMKYMMERKGLLKKASHRLPMMPAGPELQARLDKVLERADASMRPLFNDAPRAIANG